MDNRKIVVYHNKIVINNYTYGDNNTLEKMFEIQNPITFEYIPVGISYNRKEKTLTLPRGMDIRKIESIFECNAFYERGYNKPKSNKNMILIKYPPRDEKQHEALKFLYGKENYKYTRNSSQLLLALNTGAGKTYLGLVYTGFLNVKTMIIASNIGWLEQWQKAILEHTNIIESEIKMIIGKNEIINMLNSKNTDSKKIYMITHDTIASYANNNGWESINNLFKHLGIGLKIIDEAHLNFANIYQLDYSVPVCKTLYLTATPSRGDTKENQIYQEYFSCVPKLDLFDAENDPHTHYMAFLYKSGLTDLELTECCNMYGFNKQSYCDTVVYKENFDFIARIVMHTIENIQGKKIFFFATNNAIIFFYNWIRYNYPEYANDVGVYTSINPDKEKALENTLILTTSKSAGACLDIKDLMVCINMAEPTKSPPANQQRFGRTRAYGSFYIDVVDVSAKVIKNYYLNSLPMYDKYALDTKTVTFTEKQLKNTAFKIMIDRYKKYGCSPFYRVDDEGNPLWWG